jgi:cobalt-precorrin-5B (C1)-methyltransferase
MKKKELRSGYTTGACAAAAAKAAVLLVTRHASRVTEVEIPFPDGSRVKFKIQRFEMDGDLVRASVFKDAGDDPDVTNGAEIVAEARIVQQSNDVGARHALPVPFITGGKGVGTVTKPGLSVPVGKPAINPVPRKMIEEAVLEAMGNCNGDSSVEVTISVPKGEELAKKTLNYRLGITGGISILGTTGIVKPVSTEAWTATITSSMDVAKATGQKEIVVSAGRSSEKAHMNKFNFPEEAYVLMGDYLEYSMKEAAGHEFEKIHLCAQWAKMVKIAMATPQTHVRFGAINVRKAVELLNSLGFDIPEDRAFNTAREIFDCIAEERRALLLKNVCNAAKKYAEDITGGSPVITYLVSYDGEVISSSE